MAAKVAKTTDNLDNNPADLIRNLCGVDYPQIVLSPEQRAVVNAAVALANSTSNPKSASNAA